jgi:hypothetical protein
MRQILWTESDVGIDYDHTAADASTKRSKRDKSVSRKFATSLQSLVEVNRSDAARPGRPLLLLLRRP